ncbi:MAG: ABC transporter ATP-binding protein [Clostridia bacterium]|nr:ABC transporter ATP-binding protein [Clostridia bacterium]
MAIFKFENVTKKYHYDKYCTLQDFSFEMKEGISTLLMDVQSGKSTLCKLVCGMEKATSGKIYWEDKNLEEVAVVDRNILYLMQKPVFFENKTVLSNLEYPLKVRNIKDSKAVALEQIKRFNLDGVAQTKVKNLPQQTKNLVAIARGFLRQPKLVLIDGFQDQLSSEHLALLQDLINQNNASALYLTSDTNKIYTQRVAVYFDNQQKYCGDKEGVQQAIKDLVWLHDMEEQLNERKQ